jgi:hypothetical protein
VHAAGYTYSETSEQQAPEEQPFSLIPPKEANLSTKATRPVPNSGCCSEVSL